jgi:hypothetical protein
MQFMLMMLGTRKDTESVLSWPPADFEAHVRFMMRFAESLHEAGELVTAQGLDMPVNAKVVRAGDGGKPLVTDGPFAETKEFLAGFWIVDVPGPERAYEIAAAASAAPGPGGKPLGIPIEVRKVMQAPDTPA